MEIHDEPKSNLHKLIDSYVMSDYLAAVDGIEGPPAEEVEAAALRPNPIYVSIAERPVVDTPSARKTRRRARKEEALALRIPGIILEMLRPVPHTTDMVVEQFQKLGVAMERDHLTSILTAMANRGDIRSKNQDGHILWYVALASGGGLRLNMKVEEPSAEQTVAEMIDELDPKPRPKLEAKPAARAFAVTVDGKLLKQGIDYTLDAKSGVVSFTTPATVKVASVAPPAEISIAGKLAARRNQEVDARAAEVNVTTETLLAHEHWVQALDSLVKETTEPKRLPAKKPRGRK